MYLYFPVNKRKQYIKNYTIGWDNKYKIDVIRIELDYVEFIDDDICFWVLLIDDVKDIEVKIHFWEYRDDKIYGTILEDFSF